MKEFTLYNGVKIPAVGFGTYKAADGKTTEVIEQAIKAGYRYFDTASFYGTESSLGEAIKKSGVDRKEFFIASKAWKDEMGYEAVKAAFSKTLERLQTDYLDLYLIHWPRPTYDEETCVWKQRIVDTWRAFEELYKERKVHAIGVSNFLPHHLEVILEQFAVKPMLNQLELHPGYMQESTILFCEKHHIQMQAWSPIGRGRILDDELLTSLAEKYKVSIPQLSLAYLVARDVAVIPKASTMERMIDNMDIFGIELSKEDIYQISSMPQVGWSGEHPDRQRVFPVTYTPRV